MIDVTLRSRALASGTGEYLFVESGERARCGRGWSCWAAIVAAIGAAEGQALPVLQDGEWTYTPDDDDFRKTSAVFTYNNELIGTIYQCRDGV